MTWQYGTVVESALGGRYFVIERDFEVGDGIDEQTWKAMPLNQEAAAQGYVMRLTKVPGDSWKIVWQPPFRGYRWIPQGSIDNARE